GAAPIQRFQVLTKVTRSAYHAAFRSISPDHMVQFADEFGKHMADIICSKDLVLSDLLGLMRHDYYTYTHSVNVSACSVALANRLRATDRRDLEAIAAGALMHDIGKRHIPPYLLNKRGPLTDQDREQLQGHVRMGFEELCMRDDVTWAQLMMVYQHHERLDGRGYPSRLTSEEIHDWARICAVVDVFDAMRSARPYRQRIALREVMDFLCRQSGVQLDQEMVRCWNTAIRCKS
ncbi:MAG: HD domain-containing protein, partial [Gemmatimonadota bacterium]